MINQSQVGDGPVLCESSQCNICSERATRQGRMFVHTLAKFDDARRGRRVGVKLLICELTSKAMPVTYLVMSGIDSGGCYGTEHKMSCCR